MFGSVQAINENKRFSEANLNRMFKERGEISKSDQQSYEYKRAQVIKEYLGQYDVLLDIHASTSPESKVFAICEPIASDIIKYLPLEIIISGFDKVEPGGTDYYMNRIGKIGICVECGYLKNSSTKKTAKNCLLAFLKVRGHLKNDLSSVRQSYGQVTNLYHTKTNKFILSKAFADFEKIKEGQIIGIDGDKKVVAEKNGFIIFAQNCDKKGTEAFLTGEWR